MSKLDKNSKSILADLENGIPKVAIAKANDVPVTTLKDWIKRNATPTGLQPIVIVPDVHVPYHDKRAWKLVMQVARAFQPTIGIFMGDLLDCYKISSFSKDPNRKMTFKDEVRAGNRVLDDFDSIESLTTKHFIEGNHEDRLPRYLCANAPELYDFISIPKELRLEERGYEFTPYKSDMKLGKVYFTHDVGYAGQNALKQSLATYQHSIVTAHTHRFGYLTEGNAVGEHLLSCAFGWLGDVDQVDYSHKKKIMKDWTQGFGVGYFDPKTDVVYLTPVPIINYTCLVNGTLYKG